MTKNIVYADTDSAIFDEILPYYRNDFVKLLGTEVG